MLKKLFVLSAVLAICCSPLWGQVANPKNHFKAYSISPKPFGFSAFTKDQFMEDGLSLTGPILLANPVQKDTFSIIDINHHLHWYFAQGRDTLITVNYQNQFETATVDIDSARFFLVPAQKLPHAPPTNLDHYKCYRIRQSQWLQKKPFMVDQFTTEGSDSLRRDLFCTPCQKNAEPMFDTITHYVAYLVAPGQPFIPPLIRQVVDQFAPLAAPWVDTVLGSKYILVPTIKNLPPPPPDTGKQHYKTWRIQPRFFTAAPQVKDQFMTDILQLSRIDFLSNPVRKIVMNPDATEDTFEIVDPDDHLTWYRATGRDTLLRVEYVNQFESTAVIIDSVNYLLLPTQKLPHPTYDSLDHYKAYRIRNPALFSRAVQLQDQFDFSPELITSFVPVYFLTPAQKNGEQTYDLTTHYVAYVINPQHGTTEIRTLIDQFGTHDTLRVSNSEMLLVPTRKLTVGPPECSDGVDNDGDLLVDFPADCGCTDPADNSEAPDPVTQCNDGADNDGDGLIDFPADPGCTDPCDNDEFNPQPDTGPNHFKTWRIQPVPFNATVVLEDQFMTDANVRLDSIKFLSNPVRKIVFDALGIPDTFNITDPDAHLNWYKAVGKRTRLKVAYQNQFESTSVLIDSLKYLLVPAQKLPHPAPESLDHYKCYRICNPTLFNKAVLLDDQFDLTQEQITSLSATYFCTPVIKNTEPRYDSLTHYVAYSITPGSTTNESRTTIDQFGQHPAQALFSQFLLVPTEKLGVLCDAIPGDANADLALSLADVISIKNYIFNTPGCLPLPLCWLSGKICRGDTDGNGTITLADVIRLVNYIFAKPCAPGAPGTPPCCWKPLPSPGSTCCLPVPGCDPGCQ